MTISANDAHEYPIYNARYRVYFPILDADGDLVTAATVLDSERSIDGATFTDCTSEATEVPSGSGIYYLDLTAVEMTSSCTTVIVKTTSPGAKTTVLTLYPRRMATLRAGTAQGGATTSMTLDAGASSDTNAYVGCWLRCVNDVPTNALGQSRKILSYDGTTKVATVGSAWGTIPTSSTTFSLMTPEAAHGVAWNNTELVAGGIATGASQTTVINKTNLIPGTQDGKTFAETVLLMAAVLLGKASGLPLAPIFRALDDSQNRVTATTDNSGNRSVVTYDTTSP